LRKINFEFWRKTSAIDVSLEALENGSFFSLGTAKEAGKTDDIQIRRRSSSELVTSSVAAFLNDLEIGHLGEWTPFEHWLTKKLATLPLPKRSNDQRRWCQRNGLAFRLLNLPLELRSMIYGHIIGSYIWPREELGDWPKPPIVAVRVFGQPGFHKYSDRWLKFA
jgi:hypothetical protein